jgi:hypothetical protein
MKINAPIEMQLILIDQRIKPSNAFSCADISIDPCLCALAIRNPLFFSVFFLFHKILHLQRGQNICATLWVAQNFMSCANEKKTGIEP